MIFPGHPVTIHVYPTVYILLQTTEQFISEAYRLRGATYVIDKTAYWGNIVSSKYHSIEEARLIEQIRFLVDIIEIQTGNKTFRQTIGIPIGTYHAPILLNLFSEG